MLMHSDQMELINSDHRKNRTQAPSGMAHIDWSEEIGAQHVVGGIEGHHKEYMIITCLQTIPHNMPEGIEVAEIAGPIYLGILFNWALYGVLVAQVYIYTKAFHKDQKVVRWLVYGLFLLDTLQSILLARDGFITFAKEYENVEALNEAHLEWFSIPLTTAIVSCIVQCFFASRVYMLSEKSFWIPIAIVVASLTQGTAALMAGVKDLKLQKYSLLQTQAIVEITVWHVGTVVCDVLIALSMSYYLYKRDSGHKKTHEIIVKLIRLTIETGTATATLAIVDLILFLGAPGKVYFITPAFVAAKLYANTVVVIFNNRAEIVNARAHTQTSQSHGNRTNRVNLVTHDEANASSGVEVRKSVAVWND